jgi:hypothetical protein
VLGGIFAVQSTVAAELRASGLHDRVVGERIPRASRLGKRIVVEITVRDGRGFAMVGMARGWGVEGGGDGRDV